ncbi:hypothetical protein K9M79_08095 [Candidatus Woesearchaeota archaeon]|nr:hypothetical protein [Candidatus Woesearchaeota archaeon]
MAILIVGKLENCIPIMEKIDCAYRGYTWDIAKRNIQDLEEGIPHAILFLMEDTPIDAPGLRQLAGDDDFRESKKYLVSDEPPKFVLDFLDSEQSIHYTPIDFTEMCAYVLDCKEEV